MKFELFFTDFHLKKKRLEEQKKILNQIVKISVKYKVDKIYFLGDMFDNRVSVSVFELLVFDNFKKKLKKYKIKFFAIDGNHDKPFDDANKSYIGIFENEGDKIFQGKKLYRINNYGFIPYFPDNIILEIIKNYKEKLKIEFLFMHIGFKGAKTNSGYECENILTFNSFNGFKNLKNIFVGHYHERNKLFGGKIIYLGNPYQLNFGEKDNKVIYLFDGKKLKPIKLKYPKYKNYSFECNTKDYVKVMNIITDKENEKNHIKLNFLDDKEKLSSIPETDFRQKSVCEELVIEKDYHEKNKVDEYQLNFEDNIFKTFKGYAKQETLNKEEILFGIKKLIVASKKN